MRSCRHRRSDSSALPRSWTISRSLLSTMRAWSAIRYLYYLYFVQLVLLTMPASSKARTGKLPSCAARPRSLIAGGGRTASRRPSSVLFPVQASIRMRSKMASLVACPCSPISMTKAMSLRAMARTLSTAKTASMPSRQRMDYATQSLWDCPASVATVLWWRCPCLSWQQWAGH